MLLNLLMLMAVMADDPVISFHSTGPAGASLVVDGLDSALLAKLADLEPNQWQKLFPVFLGDQSFSQPSKHPPMLGSWLVNAQSLSFRPRFPFLAGRIHQSRFDLAYAHALAGWPAPNQPYLELSFTTPKELPHELAFVRSVYPDTDSVPANLLRLYLHFSQPMQQNGAYAGIRILDEAGLLIPHSFVAMPNELWDPSATRLTVLFDPGRIKRGIGPNLELGAPLKAGMSFTLEVDAQRLDASGKPMARSFRKQFSVTAANRSRINPASWLLQLPKAGNVHPLVITFPKNLDQVLVAHFLRIVCQDGEPLLGHIKVSDGGKVWSFQPSNPWPAADFDLQVHPHLEDLSGNRHYRLFDEPIVEDELQPAATVFSRPFSIR